MDPHSLRKHIRKLIEPTVDRLGFELAAVEWTGGTRGGVLRLTIDHPQGVTADDCGQISEMVSPLLDEDDPISGTYNLEISSPGIKRPLQRRQDFDRFVGYRVKLRLEPGPPRRNYTGLLKGVEGDMLVVEVDGQEHHLILDAIEKAHLVLELEEFLQLSRDDHGGQP